MASEENNKYRLIAMIVVGACMLGQILIPLVTLKFYSHHQEVEPIRGAYWNNKLWLLKLNKISDSYEELANEYTLLSLTIGSKEKPKEEATFKSDIPYLISAEDRLWIVSMLGDYVGYYKDGKVTMFNLQKKLLPCSNIFLYQGYPALLEQLPESKTNDQRLQIFKNGLWEAAVTLHLEKSTRSWDFVLILYDSKGMHILMTNEHSLYYRKGLPATEEENKLSTWKLICKKYCGTPIMVDGELYLFSFKGNEVTGIKPFSQERSPFFHFTASRQTSAIDVYPLGRDGHFAMVLGTSSTNFRVMEIVQGKIVSERNYGWSLFFGSHPMLEKIMLSYHLFIILFLFITSMLMQRYNVYYDSTKILILLASLWRRILAFLIDQIIFFVVIALIYIGIVYLFFSRPGLFSEEQIHRYVSMVINYEIYLLMVQVIIYGFFEGKWGKTPGKKLLGIQVRGLDMKPCGFGYGVIRKIVLIFDIWFFFIGWFLIVKTRNRQRLGDFLAKTIVIQH